MLRTGGLILWRTSILLTSLLTYLLTLWSRALLEKVANSQLLKKFASFYEPEVSLHNLPVPATYPYPEPDQPSPHPPSHFTYFIMFTKCASLFKIFIFIL